LSTWDVYTKFLVPRHAPDYNYTMQYPERSTIMSRPSVDGGDDLLETLSVGRKADDMGNLMYEAGTPISEAMEAPTLGANTGQSDGDVRDNRGASRGSTKHAGKSGKGSIGKSKPSLAKHPLHSTIRNTPFKATKTNIRQETPKQVQRLTLKQATTTKHKKYTCRQTHKPRIQYHDHDSLSLQIDTETCVLCAMGIPLRADEQEQDQAHSNLLQDDRATFCSSLLDALPDVGTNKIEPGERPLPIEQLSYVRLTGGPTGINTLTTTSSCKHCSYTLDQFANLASLNMSAGWVVADSRATSCYHYDCYVKLLQNEGVCVADWASLMALLASRWLYGFTIT